MDDYAPRGGSAIGRLPASGSLQGGIERRRDMDRFRVHLRAGRTYRFDLVGLSPSRGGLRDGHLRLRDSRLRLLGANNNGGAGRNALLRFEVLRTGYYYLDAAGVGSRTGRYRLSSRVERDDYASAGSLRLGRLPATGSRRGVINFAGDVDRFRVYLRAGRAYRFWMRGSATRNGSLNDPVLRLRRLNGRQLAFNNNGGTGRNAQIDYWVTRSGYYYLDASGVRSGTGSYWLSSQVDDYAATGQGIGALSPGSPRSGVINYAGDVDRFQVPLYPGTYHIFSLNGAFSDATITLRNSNGRVLGTASGANTYIGAFFSGFGPHYLDVSGGVAATGNYQLSMRTIHEDVLLFGIDSRENGPTPLAAVGGALTGKIDFSGDVDRFQVQLAAGQTYEFTLLGHSNVLNLPVTGARLRLLNGAGETLGFDEDGQGSLARIRHQVAASGLYYLDVSAQSAWGAYHLSSRIDDYASRGDGIGALGVPEAKTGTIDYAYDVDRFQVQLAADETYQFDLEGAPTSAGTLGDAVLVLRNATGASVAQDHDGGTGLNARITYQAASAGVYYLDASGLNGLTGTYRLSSQTTTPSAEAAYRPPNLQAIQAAQPLRSAAAGGSGSILPQERRGVLAGG